MSRLSLLVVAVLAATAVQAQPVPAPPRPPVVAPAPPAPPLPIDPASLDAFFSRPPTVEVNLRGALLRMAAGVTSSGDPDAAEMIRGLRGITVRVYPMDAARAGLATEIGRLVEAMSVDGWETMVRVRPETDDDDDVSIFVRALADGTLDGMVVMALDAADGDAAFVMIDGPVNPEDLARLSDRFAGTQLDAQAEANAARHEAYAAEEEAQEASERAREAEERAREAEARARDAAREADSRRVP